MNASARSMEIPKRWPLVAQQSNRSESWMKDARLVNCFAEQDKNLGEWIVQKRIGYTLDYTVPFQKGLGMYAFGPPGVFGVPGPKDVYSVFGGQTAGAARPYGNLYKNGNLFGSPGLDESGTNGGIYAWVEDQASPNHLIFAGAEHIYYLSAGDTDWHLAPTPVTGPNAIRGIAYLDQTIYFMDANGVIYNSAFNDPGNWPGSQVTANSRYGVGIQLVQQLSYIIALKSNSMEVFYDAVNPPPGSPLSPVPGGISPYGALAGTPQVIDDILLYLTSDNTVSPQVVRVDNLTPTIVSTPAIERLLDPIPRAYAGGYNAISWTFKHGGHRFYGLNFPFPIDAYGMTIPSAQTGLTLVYDIDQQLWYQWTDPDGGFWPVVSMAYDSQARHVLQGWDDGSVYIFEGDYEYPTDNGVVVPVSIYTPNADFGTRRRKTLHRMYFNTDQTPSSIMMVRRSDDDYMTWSTPRRVDLGRRRPEMRNEGTFSRRAYHFSHHAATAFRVRSVDLQMDIGVI
jgi:hypothetical protein